MYVYSLFRNFLTPPTLEMNKVEGVRTPNKEMGGVFVEKKSGKLCFCTRKHVTSRHFV